MHVGDVVDHTSSIYHEYGGDPDAVPDSYITQNQQTSPINDKSMVIAYIPDNSNRIVIIGGLENVASYSPGGSLPKNLLSGWINGDFEYTPGREGLRIDETLNGTNMGNLGSGGIFVVRDMNGDGFGKISDTGVWTFKNYNPDGTPDDVVTINPSYDMSPYSLSATQAGYFNVDIVPEPATMALLGLGGLSMLGRGMFTKKGRKYVESEVADSK